MKRLILVFLLTAATGCGGAVPAEKDDSFRFSVEAVQKESYVKGAKSAWQFISASDPDDPRYDRGLRLVARAAEGLGLYFGASMIYRQIAQVRRNMELVPDALKGIERIVDMGIYDEDTLITSFVSSEEFGDLPKETQAFVNYYQGLDLFRRGIISWAEGRFSMLPKNSSYAAKAEYVRAVQQVAEGNFYKAKLMLEQLKEHPAYDFEISKNVERTLARIAFEEERYDDALKHFAVLKKLAPNDAEIILEMAWTYYYLGDSRKTLGLLTAFDAPVHRRYISPERYLLEALALRRLCQFGAARKAAVRLERKHATSLEMLRKGIRPKDIPALRTAAKQRGHSRNNTKFTERVKMELELLDELNGDLGKGLHKFLANLYERGQKEALRREEELLRYDIAELTEELLAAEEGVRLIVHELGVSMLRGRRRPPGAAEKPAVEISMTGNQVVYPFEGEYWTDELDGLVVIAEDRCID